MTKFILDTNAVISLIENKNQKLLQNFRNALLDPESEIFITILNYYEYLRGVNIVTNVEYTKTLERYLNNTIKVIDCISLDVAKRASKIYQRTKGNEQDRRKKGKGSSDVDILMATIALSEDAIIISHDDDRIL